MARSTFEEVAWTEIINPWMTGHWIDSTITTSKMRPDDPFADTGPVLERLLKAGVAKDDICRLARHVSYESCFEMLTTMEEEKLCEEGLHEGFLSGDPSGMDGRPGSWPIAKENPQRKAGISVTPLLIVAKAAEMDISPDGTQVLAAPGSVSSGLVTVWNVNSKAEINSFKSLPNIRGAVFSPNGKSIAIGAHSGAMSVHDAATGRQVWKSKSTNCEISDVAWTSDGTAVMCAGSDKWLNIRDAKTGKEIARLEVDGSRFVSRVAVSHDGLTLAAASFSDTRGSLATFWNFKTREQVITFKIEDYRVFQLSGDGTQLLAGGSRGVFFYSPQDGRQIRSLKITDVGEVAQSPDGQLLAVTDSMDPFRIFDAHTGELLKTMDFKKAWLWKPVFSRDGKLLALPADRKGYVYEVDKLLAK